MDKCKIYFFSFTKRIMLVLVSVLPNSFSAQAMDEIYAIVNKDPITRQEFESKMKMMTAQYNAFGKTLPPKKQFAKEILSKLIDSSLQLQLAEQNNITASKAEIKEAIAGIAFRNKISYSALRKSIINSGQSFEQYQDEIQSEIIISKLQQQIIRPPQITEQQVNEYIAAHGDQDRTVAYHIEDIKISLPDNASNNDVTVATSIAKTLVKSMSNTKEIRSVIEKVNDDKYPIMITDKGYQTQAEMPTPFAKVIKKIKKNSFSQPIETPNGIHILHLINTKNVEPESFVTQLHLHHILIKPDTIGGSFEEAKKQADVIYNKIKSGQDFSEIAKESSHDPKSAAKGGELGWNTIDELPPQLALAARNLKVNQVSNPVESPVGWHLLMIKDTKKVDVSKDIERKQALQHLYQKETKEQLDSWLSKLRHSAYIKVIKKELQD
jgi:peptidyl-prolyl cis-trans isomerase SurA